MKILATIRLYFPSIIAIHPQGTRLMNDSPATLKENNAFGEGAGRGSSQKFTYPSGSRPLDGFTIKRGVGIGGFGEVYFAVSDAGKEVALNGSKEILKLNCAA